MFPLGVAKQVSSTKLLLSFDFNSTYTTLMKYYRSYKGKLCFQCSIKRDIESFIILPYQSWTIILIKPNCVLVCEWEAIKRAFCVNK